MQETAQPHAALQRFNQAYQQLLAEGRHVEARNVNPHIEACLREIDRARRRTSR